VRASCVVPCAREPRRPPWASSQGYYFATSVFTTLQHRFFRLKTPVFRVEKPVFSVVKTGFFGCKTRFFRLKKVFSVEKTYFATSVFSTDNTDVASSYYCATSVFSTDLLLCNIGFFNRCNIGFFNRFPGVITSLKTQRAKYRFSGFI